MVRKGAILSLRRFSFVGKFEYNMAIECVYIVKYRGYY